LALGVRAQAGIGKTALLDYAAGASDGILVLRAAGVETEAELAFAGLHLLLHPVLSRVGALAEPQAAALRRALGLSEHAGQVRGPTARPGHRDGLMVSRGQQGNELTADDPGSVIATGNYRDGRRRQ
jgi:hypothetical protein